MLARRPTDFRSAEKVETACKSGLPDERKLGLAEEKDNAITLTAWCRELRQKSEDTGLDTVFHVYDPSSRHPEQLLFDDWGSISMDRVTTWVQDLRTGVKRADGTREPVCNWDLDNLAWSADMVKASVTFKLWREIESSLPPRATGPEIFKTIVSHLKFPSASTSRALLEKLAALNVTKEPAMNVQTFAVKVLELVDEIEACDQRTIPPDLSTVLATCFLGTGINTFEAEATDIFNAVDDDPTAYTPRQIVTQLKSKYVSLEARGLWPHKSSQQKQHDELSLLQGKLNQLQQKVNSFGGSNNNKGSSQTQSSSKGKDLSNVVCFRCKKKGHMKRDCPLNKGDNKSSANSSSKSSLQQTSSGPDVASWQLEPPGPNQPEVKTVSGEEYKYCTKCVVPRYGKPIWRKGPGRHTTTEHKTKAELAAQRGRGGSANALQPQPELQPNQIGRTGALRLAPGFFMLSSPEANVAKGKAGWT